jgi:hypothetical protein
MVKTHTNRLINGSLKLIERIIYSNGKTTLKVLDPKTYLPTEIITEKDLD